MQYIARKNVRKSCVIKNVSLGKKNQKNKSHDRISCFIYKIFIVDKNFINNLIQIKSIIYVQKERFADHFSLLCYYKF